MTRLTSPSPLAAIAFVIAMAATVSTLPRVVAQENAGDVTVTSPDGHVKVIIGTSRVSDQRAAAIQYRVRLDDHDVILPSAFAVKLADGSELGGNCEIMRSRQQSIDAAFEQHPGKRRVVEDRCREATITLRERTEPQREWRLIVRAYNDGVALRREIPEQSDGPELTIADESTEFAFPAATIATYLPLPNFVSSHEGLYERRPVDRIASETLMDVPLVAEIPDVGWAALHEANLTNYAGMYLSRIGVEGGRLRTRLAPRPEEPAVAIRARLPHSSPWRVVFVGRRLEPLIESDLLLRLNAPCELSDVSWIKPGKTTFPWWNGFYEEKVPFTPGLNTATALHYIDFCADYGIPYHSLDGTNDAAWYGGPIQYEGDDPTTPIDGLDLPAVLKHARERGVRLRLWLHWRAAFDHMERAFPIYRQWGVEGVMIDFMDRNDQEMVGFQHRLLKLAAENQLTVTLHGVAPPTGLERTYPHLLNSEAVMNWEYDKWTAEGVPPAHDVTVAGTRMLAGPLDFHQGTLRGVPREEFRARNEAPLVIGTPCRMLASYVVYQNHLPMMADYPTAYRKHPLTRILAEIPSTWDDTRVLDIQLGQYVAIARRSGDEWWIGAMIDDAPQTLAFPLGFLGPGQFVAEAYLDDVGGAHSYRVQTWEVSASSVLSVALARAGGALIRLTPRTEGEGP
jgi:alpha-glucosidase